MKRYGNFLGLLSALIFLSGVYATPNAWLSTRYTTYSPTYTTSYYRSPVTNGYMDLGLLVDNASFTNAEFTITYDSSVVMQISSANVQDVMAGLSVSSVTTENLQGTLVKTTITLSGSVTIGEVQYESDSVFTVRLIPLAEGTVPISLWSSISPRYPESYKTCSLRLLDGGVEVPFDRKEWNDDTELFTFTDKTDSTLIYHYDNNLGNPITNGFLRIVYADDSVEDITVSDPGRGITVASSYGGYFVTPQANAVSYTLIFPEYFDDSLTLNGGRRITHSQPEGYFEVKEVVEGFFGNIETSANDITLTILQQDIGLDFQSHQYGAAIAGEQGGVLAKTFTFEEIDANSISLTVSDGLVPDYYYLYLYKDGTILGAAWFEVLNYYPVTFTIEDQSSNILPGAKVLIPQYGMFGPTNIERVADANGQAVFELPGNSEWGQFYDYFVTHTGCEDVIGSLEVYDSGLDVPVVMEPAVGLDMVDFADFASRWGMQDCQWDNYCQGADRNRDGVVDFKDLRLFAERWLLNF